MKNMLSVARGFQYSVNIAYDLHNDEKIINYMPTSAAIEFIADILSSTYDDSNDRARVLVGAYGKGKSHMVLAAMALLLRKGRNLFKNLWQADVEGILHKSVAEFDSKGKKLLPVIIGGSNTCLTQAFILSLQRTLSDYGLDDVMPETNYQAAVRCIKRWKNEYHAVYMAFEKKINCTMDDFILALDTYDINAYKQFEDIYPSLTAGSKFNPFLGFDVADLYEAAAKAIAHKGYSGLYIVYDEFSKYLEANIEEATVSDTKMLQDFAEKCNRSGKYQLHILLISHKEIANYINKLPKEKVDGWRGVSERFRHIHMQHDFGQIYEIIGRVIQKDSALWRIFCQKQNGMFHALLSIYESNRMFLGEGIKNLAQVLKNCYPLHPVALFLLPRLSEKIAQNERTLFTFLSANEEHSLREFINTQPLGELLMPDQIYDYFQPLMQKELYEGDVHQQYLLAANILQHLQPDSLQAKLVKTLALIFMVGEFEKLAPNANTLLDIYQSVYDKEKIANTLASLLNDNYVIKLHRNNGFLRLKESSGVDIWEVIRDKMAAIEPDRQTADLLNAINFDGFLYPVRYNDTKEMTRYFKFIFIASQEIQADTDWHSTLEGIAADGVVYGILPQNQEDINKIKGILAHVDCDRVLFALPQKYKNIKDLALELSAVDILREEAVNDLVLRSEYDIVYDDVYELVSEYIRSFIRPEGGNTSYIYRGNQLRISRKAQLSEFLSTIMDKIFFATPLINSEAVNKNEITSIVANNRNKVVSALLRRELEYNLGFKGSGQEVAIMRSTLLRTGVLVQETDVAPCLVLKTSKNPALADVLQGIKNIIWDSIENKKISFAALYDYLQKPAYHIGMRRGLIPIYISVVLHVCRKGLIISDGSGELPLNGDLMQQIDSAPDDFFVERLHFDRAKEGYLAKLRELYAVYAPMEDDADDLNSILRAMQNWYRSLPRYSREAGIMLENGKISHSGKEFMNVLRNQNNPHDIFFRRLPKIFAADDFDVLYEQILHNKRWRDAAMSRLQIILQERLREIFAGDSRASLVSVLKSWLEGLDKRVFEQVFEENTGRFLQLVKEYDSHDEERLLQNLAVLATGLRLDDWSEKEIGIFAEKMLRYKAEAEKKPDAVEAAVEPAGEADDYVISFVDHVGENIVKRFNRTEYSAKGRRLRNALKARLEETGQGLSTAAKRQVVMDILAEML